MLVHWDFSPEQLISIGDESMEVFLAEMVRARRLGHHVISISRRTVQWLLSARELSSFMKIQLEIIGREYTQTGNLRQQASIYLEVAPFNHDYEQIRPNRVDMSIYCIIKHSVLSKPKIIVENIDNDGWFIDFVFQAVRELSRLPKPSMHFLHGGGGDILRVLKYECDQKSVVCAFMDSDRKSPASEIDKKVQAAIDICTHSAWPLSFVKATPCHEIENFLPFSVVAELVKNDNPDSVHSIRKIIEAENHNNTQCADLYWRWFDLKNGFTEMSQKSISEDAVKWHRCKIDSSHDGQVRYIKGFGEFLIQRTARDNKTKSILARALNSIEWIDEFRDFFIKIGWIFASNKATLT